TVIPPELATLRICYSNSASRHGQFARPLPLVPIADDRRGGRQGFLRRGCGLGYAGRLSAWDALHTFHRRRSLGRRADGPVGGRGKNGDEPELAWICRRR